MYVSGIAASSWVLRRALVAWKSWNSSRLALYCQLPSVICAPVAPGRWIGVLPGWTGSTHGAALGRAVKVAMGITVERCPYCPPPRLDAIAIALALSSWWMVRRVLNVGFSPWAMAVRVLCGRISVVLMVLILFSRMVGGLLV